MPTNAVARWVLALIAAASIAGAVVAAQTPIPPGQIETQSPIPTISDKDASGSRLWVFVFDMSSIQGEDVLKAKAWAMRWITFTLTDDDLVAVVSITSTPKLQQNFTTNATLLRDAVNHLLPAQDFDPNATGVSAETQDWSFFNNDLRMRGLRTLCDGLRVIRQRKALMFFTASHDQTGQDNLAEVSATTETCKQANTTINPVDVHDSTGGGR